MTEPSPSALWKRNRRLDPEYAERERQRSRAWKAANPERVHRGICDVCGASTGPLNTTGVCGSCRRAAVDFRRRMVVVLWKQGESMTGISVELGWSRDHLGNEINRMRKLGYDLPYRYVRKKATA